ncbi:MAG: hypothetical protein JSU73_02845 [candidate division WOR-3 bacterium]|nr:MAG: hypothetical protein JSU73_02845 [candidate division WOR-3 bacterium]
MTRSVLALFLLALAMPLVAQITFERTYGFSSAQCNSVVQTHDGGYAAVGDISVSGNWNDIVLIRTDSYGDTIWTRTYGGPNYDRGIACRQTADSGYVVVGCLYVTSDSSYDICLVKYDIEGNRRWARTYGGTDWDYGWAVEQTSDKGFIIAGTTLSNGADSHDIYLAKTDTSGYIQWAKTFGGSGVDWGSDVLQASDGGYLAVGYTESFGNGGEDAWLVRTDSAGEVLWTRTYGAELLDRATSVTQTSGGGFVFTGITEYTGGPAGDVWLFEVDSAGDSVWARTFGGPNLDSGSDIVRTADGGYAVTGWTWSFGTGQSDLWLVNTDQMGGLQWDTTFGDSWLDYGRSLQQTGDDGYIVVGETFPRGIWLIKTDPYGRVAVKEPQPPVVREPAAATLLSHTALLAELEENPDLTPFDASGRRVTNHQSAITNLKSGVLFLRSPSSTRKVLVVR